ncbi:MAG: DUF4037 domain-containing protein [Sediminispirochaetaceae bacterium]
MKGLMLARRYYRETIHPAFMNAFPEEIGDMAFGLCGPGSECYRYDDDISRDHDWGPRVCVWIPEVLFRQRGEEMERLYRDLPQSCCGYGPPKRSDQDVRRDGVISIPRFFLQFLGVERPPNTVKEWLCLDEEHLSICTNGDIFDDFHGEFTSFRRTLQDYYPRDVWLKKIVTRCFMFSQYGQYNLLRSLQRGDKLLTYYNCSMCIREAASLYLLLKRIYRPYDKWLFRMVRESGPEGAALCDRCREIMESHADEAVLALVEKTAAGLIALLIEELSGTAPIAGNTNFLQDYAFQIQACIEDEVLRADIHFQD